MEGRHLVRNEGRAHRASKRVCLREGREVSKRVYAENASLFIRKTFLFRRDSAGFSEKHLQRKEAISHEEGSRSCWRKGANIHYGKESA